MRARDEPADTIDLFELAGAARRGWQFILAFALLGAAAAAVLLLIGPRRFAAASSVVIRSSQDRGASLLSKLAGADGAGLLEGGASSPLETEIQILSSRELIGKVVDSLRLQARVRSPKGVATDAVVQSVDLPGSFRGRKYTISRASGDTRAPLHASA